MIDILPLEELLRLRETPSDIFCGFIKHYWKAWARGAQLFPQNDWKTWLVLAGRGFGKTRTGAEWTREQVRLGAMRVGLIAPTIADARDTMVEGVSGLLSVCWSGDTDCHNHPMGRPVYEPSRRRVVWKNGATAMLYSAEEPERLRGPQHDKLWCDELAAWRHMTRTWDMAMLGLRLGNGPQVCVTTTPKPLELIRELAAAPDTALTRGTSYDNAVNLAPGFLDAMRARYDKTTLGRQELDGEIVEDTKDALWKREDIEKARKKSVGDFVRIVVAVDPPASSKANSAACGIVVAGIDGEGKGWVLADATVQRASPERWARAAVAQYHAFKADRIVAETNQGGDMVASVIHSVDPAVPVKPVHAQRGKHTRAEPVSALYPQGKVFHAVALPELEDEMCAFTFNGLESGKSPDRLDALVWALTELMLHGQGEPRIRRFD